MGFLHVDLRVFGKNRKNEKKFKKVLTNEKTRDNITEVAEESTKNKATRKYLKR